MPDADELMDRYMEKAEELRMLKHKVEDARTERNRFRELLEDAEEEFQKYRMMWQRCDEEVNELAQILEEHKMYPPE